jgi:hypothetical protein
MESPPPYMQPRKKSNTGLIVGLVIGGVLLCCITPVALLGGGILWGLNKAKPLAQCLFAFKDVRDGLRLYAADHDGKLPPVATWQDDVAPYYEKAIAQGKVEERKMFGVMPANGTWGCDDGSGGKTGMAFNDDVAGKDINSPEVSSQIILFEIKSAARNAHEKYEAKPTAGGPKIFGSPRGWFFIRAVGETDSTEGGMGKNKSFD